MLGCRQGAIKVAVCGVSLTEATRPNDLHPSIQVIPPVDSVGSLPWICHRTASTPEDARAGGRGCSCSGTGCSNGSQNGQRGNSCKGFFPVVFANLCYNNRDSGKPELLITSLLQRVSVMAAGFGYPTVPTFDGGETETSVDVVSSQT